VTGSEEEMDAFKDVSPDFFDLVVVDECHRGSAKENSSWRRVLDYFDSAIHLGLTATPKETKDVSTQSYFGEPAYTYSLRQGIEDGFLAPYKVVRIDLDKDLLGWRPTDGQTDDSGEVIEDRVYNQKDMDKSLVLEKRTECVAEQIVTYMQGTDPYGKAIVFCVDIDHAERTRQAIANEVATQMPEEAGNTDQYVVRITGDSPHAMYHLDDFTHPAKKYPVIATTSKLLSTGVDSQTVKLIVLDQSINSMTEFKQTIGRGTRLNIEHGKRWFTIMDFRKATNNFADPEFDGDPIVVYEPSSGESPLSDESEMTEEEAAQLLDDDVGEGTQKYYLSGEDVEVLSRREQYLDSQGKLVTESITEYTRDAVKDDYATLDDFLRRWNSSERKAAVLDEMKEHHIDLESLREKVGPEGKDLDVFDLILHVVYDQPPLTRQERANNVKKRDVFTRYGDKARAVLERLVEKYADEGIEPIEDPKVLNLAPFNELGTPMELMKAFGGKDEYSEAVRELEKAIYDSDNVA
jgi:type I restriction enzyme R subunit